jgi:hypothetical protein
VKLASPPPGALVFDHFGDITVEQAHIMKADGFFGCFAYVETLTALQLAVRLDAGLWVGFVLEGLAATTTPMRGIGADMATRASALLRTLGVPQGVHVFADLESESGLGGYLGWQNFAFGAGQATAAAGDLPGAYVAEGVGMTSAELSALPATCYWEGAAVVKDRTGALAEPSRGWAVRQGLPIDFPHPSGIAIDFNACFQDRFGGHVIGVVA